MKLKKFGFSLFTAVLLSGCFSSDPDFDDPGAAFDITMGEVNDVLMTGNDKENYSTYRKGTNSYTVKLGENENGALYSVVNSDDGKYVDKVIFVLTQKNDSQDFTYDLLNSAYQLFYDGDNLAFDTINEVIDGANEAQNKTGKPEDWTYVAFNQGDGFIVGATCYGELGLEDAITHAILCFQATSYPSMSEAFESANQKTFFKVPKSATPRNLPDPAEERKTK